MPQRLHFQKLSFLVEITLQITNSPNVIVDFLVIRVLTILSLYSLYKI